jgi:hypothetical protein
MKVKPFYSHGVFSVEIRLGNNRALFLNPQAARELANDILEVLNAHARISVQNPREREERPITSHQPVVAAPPDYLEGRVAPSSNDIDSPASLLFNGKWCGHGQAYCVFDVRYEDESIFKLRLPMSDDAELNPPIILATSKSKATFPVYDTRKHPGSIYADEGYQEIKPRMQALFRCPQCTKEYFRVSVGFEIPEDCSGSNDAIWFALAAKCANCDWMNVIYSDETA